MNIDDKECLNFATFNFLGFVGNEKIEVTQWFSFSLDRLLRIKEELFTKLPSILTISFRTQPLKVYINMV